MPRGSNLSTLTLTQLERIMERKRRELTELERERVALQKRLDAVDERIRLIGGGDGAARTSGRGGRARNEHSLVEVMAEVLQKSSKPMKVGDIAEAVRATGYRSSSPNFKGIVNQQLIKDKRFVAAERGSYQLKK